MRKSLTVLLLSSVVLTSCGSSRLNPLNWFGRSQPAPVTAEINANPLIPQKSRINRKREYVYPGTLVHEIATLKIERVQSGAIVRVKAVAAAQGAHTILLEATNDGLPVKGVLTYRMKAIQPTGNAVGPVQSRELHAAHFVTETNLVGVRSIKVEGANNARISRR